MKFPEETEIDKQIRLLQEKRRQMIADRLSGRERVNIGGMEFVIDPTCPPDTIEFRDSRTGELKAQLVNIGQ